MNCIADEYRMESGELASNPAIFGNSYAVTTDNQVVIVLYYFFFSVLYLLCINPFPSSPVFYVSVVKVF